MQASIYYIQDVSSETKNVGISDIKGLLHGFCSIKRTENTNYLVSHVKRKTRMDDSITMGNNTYRKTYINDQINIHACYRFLHPVSMVRDKNRGHF